MRELRPQFADEASFVRRVGIRIFAAVVSAVVRQRVTDTTSGFRAVNRKGIALFAADYPLFSYERLMRDWKGEGYPEEVLENVFHRNAQAFLKSLNGPAA